MHFSQQSDDIEMLIEAEYTSRRFEGTFDLTGLKAELKELESVTGHSLINSTYSQIGN